MAVDELADTSKMFTLPAEISGVPGHLVNFTSVIYKRGQPAAKKLLVVDENRWGIRAHLGYRGGNSAEVSPGFAHASAGFQVCEPQRILLSGSDQKSGLVSSYFGLIVHIRPSDRMRTISLKQRLPPFWPHIGRE